MSLVIESGGLQSTLQGRPRSGWRHMGVPLAGPADPVSAALANRLVGNRRDETLIETTFGAFLFHVEVAVSMGVTGAPAPLAINGAPASLHRCLQLSPGDTVSLGHPEAGARSYLAFAGGLHAQTAMASPSTYLPARLGGHEGRALQTGDVVAFKAPRLERDCQTPLHLQQVFGRAWALRACQGAEFAMLDAESRERLFGGPFTVSRAASRMGLRLSGPALNTAIAGTLSSAPVFPGTLQCPQDGQPILLLADAQTTGGYPRIAQVISGDRHLAGQLRSGDRIAFLHRTVEAGAQESASKRALLARWLDG